MDQRPDPPLPTPNVLTQPFWDACREHRLSLQRCVHCGKFRFYPTVACPHCSSRDHQWETVSGRGRVYSWIVVEKTHDPYWRHQVPYICSIVELQEQEGLFMPGLLTEMDSSKVRGGMPVEVFFEDASGAISLPRWRPAQHLS
jgi:uncharacterized OB-fold protein